MNLSVFDPMNLKTLGQRIHLSPSAYSFLQTCIQDNKLHGMQDHLSKVN